MGFITDTYERVWALCLDNRNKLTTTGGFIVGILVTLAFKDLYPDLESAFRQRIRQLRGRDSIARLRGRSDFVRLEDHTHRDAQAINDNLPKDGRLRSTNDEITIGIEGLIGNTPLVKLESLSEATGCEILAKAEFLNGAGNSPKDRVALSMINHAEQEGLIAPNSGDTIYEGTVGSTGISLAAVCRARGYKAHICMPDDQSQEKASLLLKLGAIVERVRPASIVDQSQFVNVARRRAQEHTADTSKPGKGFFADQFENTANYLAHLNSTGPEIFRQCDGDLDAFVAGAGTGGTISGVALALKPELPNLKVILADPQGSGLYNKVKHGVMFSSTDAEGTRRRHQVDSIVEGIGINRLTANFEASMHLIDDAVRVSDEQAMLMARWLVEKEGLFVGASSAVNCVAAIKTAKVLGKNKRIVTILCDSGSRHLSRFWKQAGDVGGVDEDVTLDQILELRIPFSVFPSSYKNNETSGTTEVKADARITVEGTGQDDRRQTRREDIHIHQEERRRPVRVTREEEVRFRDDERRDTRIEVDREHYSQPFRRYASAQIDVEDRVYEKEDRLDITERELRSRFRPSPEAPVWQDKSTYPRQFEEKVKVTEHRTFEEPEHKHKLDMGYHDNEGHYHSFRHGLEKAADRILHPIHGSHHHHHHRDSEVVVEDREVFVSAPRRESEQPSRRENKMSSTTITIPCHHVRIGDLLILQGRPCQVIRITTSAQTGQHRYLGVDLFTKQLHEESSFVSNPSPSVYVQNMLGPVFKQYRVLDITENGRVVAMTEGGDVKQGLRVLDQSELLQRLTKAYDSGRGSIRVLVINDEGRELAVDYRVIHGSRL